MITKQPQAIPSIGPATSFEGCEDRSAAFVSRVNEAWRLCEDLFTDAISNSGGHIEHTDFLEELTFCMLGGHGITYELTLSASERVTELMPFSRSWSALDLGVTVAEELSRRQFLPRLADGRLRRYRFPNAAAKALVSAREWVLVDGPEALLGRLESITDEHARRRLMCECPGIGPKKATWLLRNLGLASTLAIVDVHILRALDRADKISDPILPRDYRTAEMAFLNWCAELDAAPSAFDLFLWEWQRGSLAI